MSFFVKFMWSRFLSTGTNRYNLLLLLMKTVKRGCSPTELIAPIFLHKWLFLLMLDRLSIVCQITTAFVKWHFPLTSTRIPRTREQLFLSTLRTWEWFIKYQFCNGLQINELRTCWCEDTTFLPSSNQLIQIPMPFDKKTTGGNPKSKDKKYPRSPITDIFISIWV